MRNLFPRRAMAAVLTVVVSLAAAWSLAAQEQIFSNYNCTLTVPEGWHVATNATSRPERVTITFSAPGRNRFLALTVQSDPKPTAPLDDLFVASYERGMENIYGKKLSGQFIEVDGLKAYERLSNPTIQGKQASIIGHLILTDTSAYTVEGMRFGGAVTDDNEIAQALASFRFITRPSAPVISSEMAAYRIGYVIGRYGVFVVGAVIALSLLLRKSRKQSTSQPPPLPPTV
jgi:hypothetical protein